MIADSTRIRIERESDYQSTRLKNLFGVIFLDQLEAWNAWELMVAQKGYDSAFKKLSTSAARFGKLKGSLRLGFLKDQSFKDREFALLEVQKIAPLWRASELQRQSLSRDNQTVSKPTWSARSPERSNNEEHER